MPFAAHDRISTKQIPGGIEISPDQYNEALGRMSRGERVTIIDGDLVFYKGPVFIVDENGKLIGKSDVLQEGSELICVPPDQSLVSPVWTGNGWEEGGDIDENRLLRTRFSVLQFRDRFTLEEKIAIRKAQFEDMEVGIVYDEFQAALYIDLEDERVDQGLSLFVQKGLLTEQRKQEILEPEEING